jgi:hypothetical protein
MLSLIWVALLLACVVYAAVAFVAVDRPLVAGLEQRTRSLLDLIFPVAAVLLASVALLYQRAALSASAVAGKFDRPQGVSVSNIVAPKAVDPGEEPQPAQREESRLLALVPVYVTGKIVTWALIETIALLGLVLAFLRGTPLTAMPYAGVAMILLVLTRPALTRFIEDMQPLARR